MKPSLQEKRRTEYERIQEEHFRSLLASLGHHQSQLINFITTISKKPHLHEGCSPQKPTVIEKQGYTITYTSTDRGPALYVEAAGVGTTIDIAIASACCQSERLFFSGHSSCTTLSE